MSKRQRTMTKAERFFWLHAGYSYDPRVETSAQGKYHCAVSMARAEKYASEQDWSCEWAWDSDADLSFMTEEERQKEHECLYCQLKDADGRVLESLGGIIDADQNYRRVVEAELASQALYRIEEEEEKDRQVTRMEMETYAL